MKVNVTVPAMGESITEATVAAILKPSGSQVKLDDEILELATDKVNQVLYAQQAGVLTWTIAVDDEVKIGQVLGSIDSQGVAGTSAAAPAADAASIQKESKKETQQPTSKPSVPAAEAKPTQGGGARIAKEDFINQLVFKNENTTPKDSPQAVPSAVPTAPKSSGKPETRRKMPKVRQIIAKRLVEAQQNAAMLTTFNEIDLSHVMSLRERYKETFLKEHGVKLGFMSFFVKATVAALKELPDLNSYIDGDEIVHREYYDIGIAVGTEKRGLVVPVVRNCDTLSFAGIEKAIEIYAKKAREGGLSVDDLQGGGFTITNGGVYGSLLSTPILNAPQPGILGMHKIIKRPVVVNDQIVIRPMMYVALSYDHRIVDGKEAVTFLVAIKNYLEDTDRLLLDI
jgi:2-oxoglutarate dehydrogenase E2 component (dihydrolipoamide succinyltransferase)